MKCKLLVSKWMLGVMSNSSLQVCAKNVTPRLKVNNTIYGWNRVQLNICLAVIYDRMWRGYFSLVTCRRDSHVRRINSANC